MPQQRHFVVFRLRWRHNEKWPTKPSKAWDCRKNGSFPNTSTGNAAISKDQLLLIKRYTDKSGKTKKEQFVPETAHVLIHHTHKKGELTT